LKILTANELAIDKQGNRQKADILLQVVADADLIDGKRRVQVSDDRSAGAALIGHAVEVNTILREAQIFANRRTDERYVRLYGPGFHPQPGTHAEIRHRADAKGANDAGALTATPHKGDPDNSAYSFRCSIVTCMATLKACKRRCARMKLHFTSDDQSGTRYVS
jgi:hypothetical protein